jgi:hypothetical protein
MGYSTKTIKDWRMQVRRGNSAEWVQNDHVLLEGELGWESDTNKLKIGNGINSWNNLPYLTTGSSGGGAANIVTDYRSEFETDNYIYAGFLLNSSPVITRVIDNTLEEAQGVTDLETDWTNRINLTYI